MNHVSIYKLEDAAGAIRYIGYTIKPLSERLQRHLSEAKRGGSFHRLTWLRSLSISPKIALIEECLIAEKENRERHWISLARAYGCRLVNSTPGGEGLGCGADHPMFGRRLRLESREKIGKALRGRPRGPRSAHSYAAMRKKLTGRKLTAKHRANISKGMLGRKRGPYKKRQITGFKMDASSLPPPGSGPLVGAPS